MSVQRFIYPSIWRCPELAALSPDAQLLFIGCFSTADDEGRRSADPALLKADVFPLRTDISPESVRDLTRTCADAGLIRAYGAGKWLDLPNWHKYQAPKYKKASKIPPFRPEPAPTPGGTRAESARDPGYGLGLGLGLGLGRDVSGSGLGRGAGEGKDSEASPACAEKPAPKPPPKIPAGPAGRDLGGGGGDRTGTEGKVIPDAGPDPDPGLVLTNAAKAIGVSAKVLAKKLKNGHTRAFLLAHALAVKKQSPGDPVAYFEACLANVKGPHDSFLAEAHRLLGTKEWRPVREATEVAASKAVAPPAGENMAAKQKRIVAELQAAAAEEARAKAAKRQAGLLADAGKLAGEAAHA